MWLVGPQGRPRPACWDARLAAAECGASAECRCLASAQVEALRWFGRCIVIVHMPHVFV